MELKQTYERILTAMAGCGVHVTAADLAHTFQYSKQHMRNLTKDLVEIGLLEQHGPSHKPRYSITDLGERYVDGEDVADELLDDSRDDMVR